MEWLTASGRPFIPLLGDFPDSGIWAAGYIADNPVEAHPTVFSNMAVLVLEFGEDLSVVISDDNICRI